MKSTGSAIMIVALLAACASPGIPGKGLVAAYSLAGGRAEDASGSENHGRRHRAREVPDRFGRKDHAMRFDSPSDYVAVESPGFLRATRGTVVAWVKFDEVDAVQYVVSVGDENSVESYLGFLRLDPATKTLGVYCREPGAENWAQGSTIISPGMYYCLVIMSDGRRWSLYINGIREELTPRHGSNRGTWVGDLHGIDNFVIGSSRLKPPHDVPFLKGVVDGVLVYDRPLKRREVRALQSTLTDRRVPY